MEPESDDLTRVVTAIGAGPAVPALVDELLAGSGMTPEGAGDEALRQGVVFFFTRALATEPAGTARSAVDAMIADIDRRLNAQINGILHHRDFQQLEASWRGLKLVVDRVDFDENIEIAFTNISRDDLEEDLEDAPALTKSGLFALTYSATYDLLGGEPYGLICGNYEFDASRRDIALLKRIAAVATMAHAPFVANVGPRFFGFGDFAALAGAPEIKSLLEAPPYAPWRAFRASPNAGCVGLCLPRFLGRRPYDERTHRLRDLSFTEVTRELGDYLWCDASLAFATRVAAAFAQHRWYPNVIGPESGGAVEDLPRADYDALAGIETKSPTEVALTKKREIELSEEGFIGLTGRRDTDSACFCSANSCQAPDISGTNGAPPGLEMSHLLGSQLLHMLIVTRLAQFIKVVRREQLAGYDMPGDLSCRLNDWLNEHVTGVESPDVQTLTPRPLRKAWIEVEDATGRPGKLTFTLAVQPEMEYSGASLTLSVRGRLDGPPSA